MSSLKSEERIVMPYAFARGPQGPAAETFRLDACGLPVLYLTGSVDGMTKENAVKMQYSFREWTGSCTVKWQGASSIAYPKKNYTIKFDQAFEAKAGWGAQRKYCLKANWMDASHARNLLGAQLWGRMCASRRTVDEALAACPNWGAVDGFPVVLALNDVFHGLYTFNIPKDGWMLGMNGGNREAIVCAEAGDACRFKAEATLSGDFKVEYAGDEADTGWIADSLNRLIDACMRSDGSDIDTVLALYVDIDSAIDYMIHVCATANPDNLSRNYLLSTRDGVKWAFTAYDMDMGFGIWWGGEGFTTADDSPFFRNFAAAHRLMELLYTYKADAVKARYNALRREALSEISLAKQALDFASGIPLYVRNEEARRWPAVPGSGANTVYQILEYLRLRFPRLDAEVEAMVQQSPVEAPVMAASVAWYDEEAAGATQNTITKVTLAPSYAATGDEDATWACDADGSGAIMAYRTGTEVTIAPTTGATRICLNADSTNMFASRGSAALGNFAALTAIEGSGMLVAKAGTDATRMCRGTPITSPIHIPEGVTSVNNMFDSCSALEKPPVIPEGVTSMDSVCLKCAVMDALPQIPSTVQSMSSAFQECYGVTDASGCVIPEGVTNLSGTFLGLANASGTIVVNAANLTAYANAFRNAAKSSGCQITLTGDCPLLAELAATKGDGNVVVG